MMVCRFFFVSVAEFHAIHHCRLVQAQKYLPAVSISNLSAPCRRNLFLRLRLHSLLYMEHSMNPFFLDACRKCIRQFQSITCRDTVSKEHNSFFIFCSLLCIVRSLLSLLSLSSHCPLPVHSFVRHEKIKTTRQAITPVFIFIISLYVPLTSRS